MKIVFEVGPEKPRAPELEYVELMIPLLRELVKAAESCGRMRDAIDWLAEYQKFVTRRSELENGAAILGRGIGDVATK